MNFIEYSTNWADAEVQQGKVMMGVGILLSIAFVLILRGENILLRGSLIPLGLLLAVLIGYGSYILYSRPAHSKEIIMLYTKNSGEAIKQEIAKHEGDNKAGKLLLRTYPILMLISVIALIFVSSSYHKGMALGFILFFVSAFIIDTGFVSRSARFLSFLRQ